MLLNCGVGEDSWESFGLQGDPTSPRMDSTSPRMDPTRSILKEISPGCSLEGLMLKLKLQYFGHLICRANLLEKTDAGKDWGREEKGTTWGGWMASPTHWTWVWANSRNREGQGSLACCTSWGHKESDATERLNNNNKWQHLQLHLFQPRKQLAGKATQAQYT